MPRMSDLWRLLEEDHRLREDFISILGSFFERHNIEVSLEDLQGAEDVVGFLFPVNRVLPASQAGSASGAHMEEPPAQPGAEQTISSQDGGCDDDNP